MNCACYICTLLFFDVFSSFLINSTLKYFTENKIEFNVQKSIELNFKRKELIPDD